MHQAGRVGSRQEAGEELGACRRLLLAASTEAAGVMVVVVDLALCWVLTQPAWMQAHGQQHPTKPHTQYVQHQHRIALHRGVYAGRLTRRGLSQLRT